MTFPFFTHITLYEFAVWASVVIGAFVIVRILISKICIKDLAYRLWAKFHVPFIVLVAAYGAISLISPFFKQSMFLPSLFIQIRSIITVLSILWVSIRWKVVLVNYLLEQARDADRAIIIAIGRLATIVIYVIFCLAIFPLLGVPLQGVIAFGGVSGIGISWAAKDIVANFFGGLMVYINRHFTVGDYIRSENKKFEGRVIEIGWYLTLLRSPEDHPMYVPNALMTGAIIENIKREKQE